MGLVGATVFAAQGMLGRLINRYISIHAYVCMYVCIYFRFSLPAGCHGPGRRHSLIDILQDMSMYSIFIYIHMYIFIYFFTYIYIRFSLPTVRHGPGGRHGLRRTGDAQAPFT